jgi:hypothetical protein
MTEAVRTYVVNPNWIKTMAPRTAARIREWVNTHPELSKIIQFNSLVAGSGGLALAGQSEDSEAREISGEGRRHQPSMFQAPHSILEPPTPFELVNGDTKSGSTARRQIAHALIRRGIMPPTRSTGKFASLARAILDAQAKQKTPTFGGPR